MKFGVQAQQFGSGIDVGRLGATGEFFTAKEEATDMVLGAVVAYVIKNFNGGVVIDFPKLAGGVQARIEVTPLPGPTLTLVPEETTPEENPS